MIQQNTNFKAKCDAQHYERTMLKTYTIRSTFHTLANALDDLFWLS